MDLKQSTTITVQVGPFLDKTDGVTEETGLSPTVEISKNGGTFAARNSATAITHDADGWYKVELDTTDTNTLSRLQLKVHAPATHLPVWHEYNVIVANTYNSKYGSSAYSADMKEISGGIAAADNLQLACEAYSVTRGLAGTALPAAAADAAGGVPVSDAGGLDMDAIILDTDTLAQLPQQAPPSAPTFEEAIMYVYQYLRNYREQDATTIRMYADDGTTIIAKATISDDATDFVKAEFVTGP